VNIDALYQQLDPLQPLPADETRLYVDWQHEMLGPDDVKPRLVNSIARSGATPVTRLFTGHRGTGKTTELFRVQQQLRERKNVFVSFLECEQWMDLNDVRPPDLLLQMVRQLVADLKAAGASFAWEKLSGFFGELRELVSADVQLKDLKLSAGPMEIGLAIRDIPGARAALRKLLEERLPRLYDLVNQEILGPSRKWLEERSMVGTTIF